MLSYTSYRLVHLVGVILLFAVLGGLSYGAARTDAAFSRKAALSLHGVALFVVLLGGFGLLARIGVQHGDGFPGWVWGKLGIWGLLAVSVALPRRKPEWAGGLFLLLPLLGGLAAWLALFKPL